MIRVDGRTYAAVEVDENIMCKGCIFFFFFFIPLVGT